jgi:hypothetical protein
LGDGSKRDSELAVRDGKTVATLHNQPVGSNAVLPAPSPQSEADHRADLDRQKQILRERGLL